VRLGNLEDIWTTILKRISFHVESVVVIEGISAKNKFFACKASLPDSFAGTHGSLMRLGCPV
jgi:hypothetical protein